MSQAGDEQFGGGFGSDPGASSGDGPLDTGAQLTLTGDDDALPWLESDDDEAEEGSDYRILFFAIGAVGLLVALLVGASLLFDDGPRQDVTADGSTIEAPDQPYKERPDDPGGSQVAGTGDVSYEVGEGQGREGRLADDTPAPSLSPQEQSADNRPDAAPPAAAPSGVGVQVGAYSSRAAAETGWQQLSGRFSVLQGVSHRVIEGTVDGGAIYRLQAVAGNGDAADALCRAIRNAGGDCQVKY